MKRRNPFKVLAALVVAALGLTAVTSCSGPPPAEQQVKNPPGSNMTPDQQARMHIQQRQQGSPGNAAGGP
jgi:hypothetical protein